MFPALALKRNFAVIDIAKNIETAATARALNPVSALSIPNGVVQRDLTDDRCAQLSVRKGGELTRRPVAKAH